MADLDFNGSEDSHELQQGGGIKTSQTLLDEWHIEKTISISFPWVSKTHDGSMETWYIYLDLVWFLW